MKMNRTSHLQLIGVTSAFLPHLPPAGEYKQPLRDTEWAYPKQTLDILKGNFNKNYNDI